MSDLIKRSDVINVIEELPEATYEYTDVIHREKAIEKIESIPSAERKGRNLLAEYPPLFECSEFGTSCHDTIPWDCNINYCPNCGADMRGAEDVG